MEKVQNQYSVIAIDGPAGSGKSTTARLLAKKLGFLYLDTGAMYRAITLKAMRRQLDLNSESQLRSILKNTKIALEYRGQHLHVLLDGEDVTREIRSIDVSNNVSQVAAHKPVREFLVRLQREFAQKHNVIAEGRDIGTVVFPNAELKVFLIASLEERARRRLKADKKTNENLDLRHMKEAIKRRDAQDSTRVHSPLKKAEDAIEIDTSNLTIEQQVDFIAQLWERISNRDKVSGNGYSN